MSNFIIKPSPVTEAELRARGAILVDDSKPGTGFTEDVTDLPGADSPEVQDVARRAQEVKTPEALQEATQEALETNTDAVRKFRFTHQDELTDWIPGRILWLGDFLDMLQTIRPDAFYAEYSYMGLRGLGFVDAGVPFYSGTSVMNGNMPEWSKLRTDHHRLPKNEAYRGWRTVLLALIQKDIITLEQSDQVFGEAAGPRSKPWYRALYGMRNHKCFECQQTLCECLDKWDYLRADAYQYAIPEDIQAGKRQQIQQRSESRIWTP
jgi:hypothetical protein